MNPDETTRKQLEVAFEPAPGDDRGGCPQEETVWEAARGRLSVEQNAELLDHVSGCARCVEAWKLARELAGETGDVRGRRLPRGAVPALLAAAAVLALFFILPNRESPRPDADPEFRGSGVEAIASSIEGQPLPRDACVLRWSPGPEGAIYRLELSTTAAPLPAPPPILDPEFRIPAAWLEGVASGTNLYWRVRMSAPGGAESASPTFVNAVE